MSSVTDTDVLILGASFAGIEVLHELVSYAEGSPPATIVIDRLTRHGYLPLVQERLCGRLDPDASVLDTASYVRSVPRAQFVAGEVVALDPETKVVTLASGAQYRGRFVVVALGSESSPPQALEGREHILGYKTPEDFDRAARAIAAAVRPEPNPRAIAVIGGGVSGVELAAELADLVRTSGLSPEACRISLITSSDRLLPTMSPRVARHVARRLEAQHVELRLRTRLVSAHPEGITLNERRGNVEDVLEMMTTATLWAAGIGPSAVLSRLGLPRNDAGWLVVGPSLQCFPTPKPTKPDLFACGDAVRIRGGEGEWPTMQRAIECIWQAKVVARNLLRMAKERPDYPNGVPSLLPHRLRREFFYGVSLGARSMIVYRHLSVDMPRINREFRRWLMRQYFARYTPLRAERALAPG